MNTKKLFLAMTLLWGLFAWTAKADVTKKIGSSDGGTTLSPGADYKSMTAAFNALNGFTGVVNLQIIDNTTETSTIYYTKSASWTTLNIYPTVTGKTISGNISGPLFNLTAVSGMVIDGRLHNADGSLNGSTRDLTITNTGGATVLGAVTLRLEGNSSGNTIKYCTIKGSGTANYRGIITILAGATLATGNGNNTISNNLFTCADNAKRPTWSIYSSGTSAAYPNNNLTITDNEFADFLSTNAGQGTGGAINLGASTSACTITGNSFYETTLFTPTASPLACSVINVSNSSGTGFNISNNYIGGSAALCAGPTPFRKTNAFDNVFYAINVTVGATPVTTVTNNTIQKFDWGNSANAMWTGINIGGAAINVTGNTIGATTGTGSINYTGAGPTNAQFYGINFGQSATSAGTGNCSNNNIGSITMNSVPATMYGLFNSSAGTTYFENNIIGSTTTANSINAAGTGALAHNIMTIRQNGAGNTTISGNTIANITNSANTGSQIQVMLVGAGTNTINGNFIYNIFSPNSTSAAKASMIGINFSGSAAGSTSTLSNNIISLGGDAASTIIGIQEANAAATATTNVYFNTIYIGGSEISGSTAKSYCLTSSGGVNKNIKNNVLVNTRSTVGGSSQHYAFSASAPSGTFVCDYNDYFVSGVGSKLGYYGGADKTTSVIVTGQDVNSQAVNPSFTGAAAITAGTAVVADYKVITTTLLGVTRTGISTDYGSAGRPTSPAMGAWEVAYFQSKASGNWADVGSWQSSKDNSTFVDVTYAPTKSAASVTVLNSHLITVAANATTPSLTINSGGKVTINSGNTLGVTGDLTINSDATNGTGTIVDANTNGGLTVSGTSTVNQSLQHYQLGTIRTWYLTPPVASATPTGMSSIRSYNEGTNTWNDPIANPITTMLAKTGYSVAPALAANNISFTGTLNTGNQNVSLTSRPDIANKAGFNLIGNPYPSYLDWTLVTANAANTALMRSTTMWYRTKSAGTYYFWTVNGDGVSSPIGVNAKIPPMQAFWVRANADGGTLALTNAMRAHAPASDKLLKAPAAKNTVNTLVRFQVSNGTNTDEAVLYFSSKASNGMDAYDAPKMSNENVDMPEIYTTLGSEQIVINGMNTIPLDTPIGLGFVAGNATSFSLLANEVSNLPADVKVILKDNITNVETDLTDGVATYQFSPVVTSSDRFSVIFRTPGAVTGLENKQDNSILVFSNAPHRLTVICNDLLNLGSIASVYNAIGQKLISQQLTGTSTQIRGTFTPGVYAVKVNNTTKKVIIN